MAIEFSKAVAYALSCINQPDLLLKDKQEQTLRYLFEGRDVFAWFPTGYDKSLCVQLLPYMFDYKLERTSCSDVQPVYQRKTRPGNEANTVHECN